MANARQIIFPYCMHRNSDGSWTFLNRNYKPVGLTVSTHTEYDNPDHKLFLKGLGPAKRAQLETPGAGDENRIYLYDDASNPEISPANMTAYLKKLQILLKLQEDAQPRRR